MYPLSKQNKQKNVFGGHFPTENNGVTDYMSRNTCKGYNVSFNLGEIRNSISKYY